MGPCASKTEEDIRSKQIDAMMRKAKQADDEVTKLLLLGAGKSSHVAPLEPFGAILQLRHSRIFPYI